MHKYCETTTLAHPLSKQNLKCQCSIKQIIKAEGGRGNLFGTDVVLNLDKVERKLVEKEKREQKKTMDVFFGVSENTRNKKIALIEFKFDVKNPNQLRKTELESKVRDSKIIIGSEMPVYNRYCFVFKADIIQQAIYKINRLFEGKPNNPFKAETEETLHQLYW